VPAPYLRRRSHIVVWSKPNERLAKPPRGGVYGVMQVIHLTSLQTRPETDHVLCASLVAQHKVPKDLRFNLLTRVRAARAFGTLDGRRQITALRLLALTVLLQSNPDPGAHTPCACPASPLAAPFNVVSSLLRARTSGFRRGQCGFHQPRWLGCPRQLSPSLCIVGHSRARRASKRQREKATAYCPHISRSLECNMAGPHPTVCTVGHGRVPSGISASAQRATA
jgi:hypothetical protein